MRMQQTQGLNAMSGIDPKSRSFASSSLTSQALQQDAPKLQGNVNRNSQASTGGGGQLPRKSTKAKQGHALPIGPLTGLTKSTSNDHKLVDSKGLAKGLQFPVSKRDPFAELLQQWAALDVLDHHNGGTLENHLEDPLQQWAILEPLDHRIGGTHEGRPQDPISVEETIEPTLLKAIHDQTDVVQQPPRITGVGIINPLEGTDQTAPHLTNHIIDESELGNIFEIPENLDDLVSLLGQYEKAKLPPTTFHPRPGDVIIAAKPKSSSLKVENSEPSMTTMTMEAEPLEFYPSNDPSCLHGLVALYQDSFYFIDGGEYKRRVSDVYDFQQGDIVARLGHFDESWHWTHASKFNFYLYYPKKVEGECCTDFCEVGPWFLLTKEETSQTGGLEPDPPPKVNPSVKPFDLLPFSTVSYPFELSDGDILIHHINDKTMFRPWNLGLIVTVENSKNRGELGKILQPMDKILRYGMHVELDANNDRESTTIYVELYQFHNGLEWKFLGKNEALYNHVATLPTMIRLNVNTPQPGDIFINRRSCKPWDSIKQIGGPVDIYKDESFFSLLEKPREDLQSHHWGIGSDTTVVRFGTFANKEWNWMPKPTVDIFILNARGTSLWRHCRIPWDDEWRPKANYNFDQCQVPGNFKPTTGDVIIRYLGSNLVWHGFDQIGEPSVKIEFFNAMHLVGNRLGNGDWLLRVGYERSDQNPTNWTHVTAELYRYKVNLANPRDRFWEFKGRDVYVFGALQWPERHGLFSGKGQEQPYADPDDDLQKDQPSAIKTGVDNSRALRLFLNSLGFQNMAYPLRCPWWYDISPDGEIGRKELT